MQDPSFIQSRPFFGCFIGTFSPSRRHRRSTRLSLTCQPASRSKALQSGGSHSVHTDGPVRSCLQRDRSSSERPTGSLRCVDLCCFRTRQARRSETFNSAANKINTSTTASGAQKFPFAASAKINLSSVKSETALRNRSFSFCRRLSSFNWSVPIPPYFFFQR